MTTPGFPNPLHPSAADEAESELQQELRVLFVIDTQQHLQSYFTLVQQLTPQAWTAEIQHIYRAVHTIKGGAVTVDADALLHAAMSLEDLLSDLRYLDSPPDLTDGSLSRLLLEAGELLSSSIEITAVRAEAIAQVQPTVRRLQAIHTEVKLRYIPDWSELKQVHQEFAEEGFDLVVLELEMALGNLPAQGPVPLQTRETAQQTLEQLAEIGRDLQFAAGWATLLQECAAVQPDSAQWRQSWPTLFNRLKNCAKQGGIETDEASPVIERIPLLQTDVLEDAAFVGLQESPEFSSFEPTEELLSLDALENFSTDDLWELDASDLLTLEGPEEADQTAISPNAALNTDVALNLALNQSERIEEQKAFEAPSMQELSLVDLSEIQSFDDGQVFENDASAALDFSDLDNFDSDSDLQPSASLEADFGDFGDLESLGTFSDQDINQLDDLDLSDLIDLEASNSLGHLDFDLIGQPDGQPEATGASIDSAPASTLGTPTDQGLFPAPDLAQKPDRAVKAPLPVAAQTESMPKRDVQIAVPLDRLDQSAQQVIETLLSARAAMNSSQKLQDQITQITALTQESAQFVTRLRQLQDDYALLRDFSDEENASNLSLERYRQGYSTINRLLENILRMSELGQEIETVAQQSVERLDKLDRNILRLKSGIETSRLVSFKTLAARSKAILRDLTNRYGKPAELSVIGEQVEIDAGVIQQLEPLLLHLLRNAYDHGLESPEERLSAGKSMQGSIVLTLQRRGSLYRLSLKDDGRGIDLGAIQRQAQEKGFPLTRAQTAAELLAVLCQPGFSSRSAISEVSGRGVGMDVVAGQIEALGGKLSLQTQIGQGTTFIVEIPAPQLLVPCVLLQVGDRTVALPTEEILETVLASSIQVLPTVSEGSLFTWSISSSRGAAPGFELCRYWSLTGSESADRRQSLPDTAICIRTRQEADSATPHSELWLIADDLISQNDLLISPLPSPLIAPKGLLGVSLQPDGTLVSILDPVALADAIQAAPSITGAPSGDDGGLEDETQAAVTILVVDDAALMRRRIEGSLQTYGYATHTCGDGVEALSWLQANPLPDLIITDVEMPNMDGFTLIDRCRQLGMTLPILVVSSRLSQEWGREAQRLGASDYLNKGFSTPELLQKVGQCLDITQPVV
jgi:chemotaxis protein histidine kinase CheA